MENKDNIENSEYLAHSNPDAVGDEFKDYLPSNDTTLESEPEVHELSDDNTVSETGDDNPSLSNNGVGNNITEQIPSEEMSTSKKKSNSKLPNLGKIYSISEKLAYFLEESINAIREDNL